MELWQEILVSIFQKEEIRVDFPNLTLNTSDILKNEALAALQKIKEIIEDDSLDDFECVEQIVIIFEEIGSSGGGRHDF